MAAPNHHRKRNPKDTTVLEVQMPRLIPCLVIAKGKIWLSSSPLAAWSHHLLLLVLAIAGLGMLLRGGSPRDCGCWSGCPSLLPHGISTIRPYPQCPYSSTAFPGRAPYTILNPSQDHPSLPTIPNSAFSCSLVSTRAAVATAQAGSVLQAVAQLPRLEKRVKGRRLHPEVSCLSFELSNIHQSP